MSRLLQRRGLLDEDTANLLWEREPLLAGLTSASIRGHPVAAVAEAQA